MASFQLLVLAVGVAAISAFPAEHVVYKLPGTEDGPRYQYVVDANGKPHLEDMWVKTSDLEAAARFNPDTQIVYHLFTRQNPSVSQPLLNGGDGLLGITNYDARRRTIILLHGWRGGATSPMNTLLVPAFLSAEDLNVIVVDWNAGAGSINYATAVTNTVPAGEGVARFIDWLNHVTGAVPTMYHVVGHSLGAHQAGVIGRNVHGTIAYITGLDAALPGFISSDHALRPSDSAYTEVIHTNAGNLGFISTLGHVDFYPNEGIGMPGCDSMDCDHSRCYYYLAESLTSGGFTGRRCASFATAMSGNCLLPGTLNMGGLVAKTGSSGVFHLETNASPPFSRG